MDTPSAPSLTCSARETYRTRSLEKQLEELNAAHSTQVRRASNPMAPSGSSLSRTSINDLYFDSSALRNMLKQSLAAKFTDKACRHVQDYTCAFMVVQGLDVCRNVVESTRIACPQCPQQHVAPRSQATKTVLLETAESPFVNSAVPDNPTAHETMECDPESEHGTTAATRDPSFSQGTGANPAA